MFFTKPITITSAIRADLRAMESARELYFAIREARQEIYNAGTVEERKAREERRYSRQDFWQMIADETEFPA